MLIKEQQQNYENSNWIGKMRSPMRWPLQQQPGRYKMSQHKVRRFFSFILRVEVEMHFTYFLCSPSPSLRTHCCCLTPFKKGGQPTCCIFCKSRITPCCRGVLLFLLYINCHVSAQNSHAFLEEPSRGSSHHQTNSQALLTFGPTIVLPAWHPVTLRSPWWDAKQFGNIKSFAFRLLIKERHPRLVRQGWRFLTTKCLDR